MTYLTQNDIAFNEGMSNRIAQCVTLETSSVDADNWTNTNRRKWAAAPGWDEAWEYAKNTHPQVDDEPIYDPGRDETVITDGMILSQVQSMLAEESGES